MLNITILSDGKENTFNMRKNSHFDLHCAKLESIKTDDEALNSWWNQKTDRERLGAEDFPAGILNDFPEVLVDELADELWAELEDVTTDEDGFILSDWMCFKAGTFNEDIWHWFESNFHDFLAGWGKCVSGKDIAEETAEFLAANGNGDLYAAKDFGVNVISG